MLSPPAPLDRPTALARLRPWPARLVLAAALGTAVFFVAVTQSSLKSGYADAPDRGPGDIALYRAEVERIHQGEAYYAVAADELRTRGYPTRSLFNWRTPLPMWLLGQLPDARMGQAALAGMVVLAGLLAFGLLSDRLGRTAAVVGTLAWTGATLPYLLDGLFVMPELWAGALIGLSAVGYGTQRRKLGFVAALAALVLRELAAPWCLVCCLVDARERRWRSVATWFAGFAVYMLLYAVHAGQVLPRIGADDIAHPQGWVRFGGAGFLISTAQMNGWLLLVPQWATALYLAAALLGAAGWSSQAGERISLGVAAYAIAFSLVGQSFNQYWGSLTAPLLCLAVAAFPAALGDLVRAALGRPAAVGLPSLDARPN